MIEIKELTKIYKDTVAVDKLSLNIDDGELVSFLGINGAGKSTTVKMLSCLTCPTSGDAFINGKSIVKNREDVKKIIAVVPQEEAVAQGLTVKENLQLIAGIYNIDNCEKEIADIAEKLGLTDYLNKKASKLSGGYKRRLSIAMALITKPKILFLDEPTVGLDVIARSELWDIILSLKGKTTMFLTTHYMEEAEKLSDRVAIMKNGKLIKYGTQLEIKKATGCEKFEEAFVKLVKEAE